MAAALATIRVSDSLRVQSTLRDMIRAGQTSDEQLQKWRQRDESKGLRLYTVEDGIVRKFYRIPMDVLSTNTAILKEKCWQHVNPHGVASGVATPGRNTTSKSLCFNAKSHNELGNHEIQDTDSDELTFESVQAMYEELYEDWIKRNKINSMLSKENTELKSSVSRLEVLLSKKDLELCKVKDDLEKATKTIDKFSSSASKLDSMLTMGKDNRTGLGYVESTYEHGETSNSKSKSTVFVKASEDCSVLLIVKPPMKTLPISKQASERLLKQNRASSSHLKLDSPVKMPQTKKPVSTSKSKQRKRQFICHYCHKPGHIKPFCFKLRNDCMNWHENLVLPTVLPNTKRNTTVKKPHVKKVWVPKAVIHCNVIYTSLKTNIAGAWYFDSGCSHHMTGSKGHLTDYVEVKSGRVTYGSGAKGRIVGKGTLNVDGLPELHNFLIMSMFVMSSTRSADNSYQLGEGDGCLSANMSDLDLWHKKLGHVSFKTLKNLCKFDAVRGYVLNDRDHLAKFYSKNDKCLFLGYSTNSHAYRVFNLRTRTTMESINVVFDDLADLTVKTSENDVEELLDISEALTRNNVESGVETSEATPSITPPRNRTETVDNDNDDDDDVVSHSCFVSQIEPKNINDALKDEFWVNAMHEKLEQFVRNDVCDLVPRPLNTNVIGTKWIFKNKTDESGNIVWNKARLVAQGYTQVEGEDFDETFSPVARIESVRLMLGIACHMHIKLYQMNVKSAFLNGILNEETYVSQPKGFEYPHHLDHVYKLKKALYGLKQAPRAWYGRLAEYLINLAFKRGEVAEDTADVESDVVNIADNIDSFDYDGFLKKDDDTLFDVSETLKIASPYFKGNRKLDLPWSVTGVATGQIQKAKGFITYYVAEYSLLLEVVLHSGQKGGVGGPKIQKNDAEVSGVAEIE
ncbi:uncharacterized protein LOC142544285 [Primulina tabacum]|uniref:uncharacterized protein LOC142544285 n=1 Tax=Primulina tabacum TaxID=48773 RepID=UPI003F5934BE